MPDTALVNLLHHADDGVPIALVTHLSELKSSAKRGAPREVTFGKRLVDDGGRRAAPAVRWVERTALAHLRSNDRKVVAAHYPKQRDLIGHRLVGLASELIECRLPVVAHRNS